MGLAVDDQRIDGAPDIIDAAGMERVADLALEAVGYLADRTQPLGQGGHPGARPAGHPAGAGGGPTGGMGPSALGSALTQAGLFQEAEQQLQESISLASRLNDDPLSAAAYNNLGNLKIAQNAPKAAH